MKYFCHSCETIQDSFIEAKEPFSHHFGVDYVTTRQCPNCEGEQLEEVVHGYLVKSSKDTRIIYEDEELIDYIHEKGKVDIEEF